MPPSGVTKITDKEFIMDKLVELGSVSEETKGTTSTFTEGGQLPCSPVVDQTCD